MAANSLVPISTVCSSSSGHFNTLGVVVDRLEVFQTKGPSKCITFTIKDSDFSLPSWSGGLKVKYFNNDESCLPLVRINDLVLLRGIRVAIIQNRPTGVSSHQDSIPWVIFRPEPAPSSSLFVISGPVPFEPSLWEKDQAQSLLDRVSAELGLGHQHTSHSVPVPKQVTHVQASRPAPKGGGLPFSLIKDIKPRQLYQLLGQVVKLNTYDSEKCLMYMTDYTENPLLPHKRKPGEEGEGTEGDRYNYLRNKNDWPGPWGQLNIQVALWEPHASFAREHITPNDIVLLTYVQVKEARDLEASVHEDRRFPDKIHIQIIKNHNDERVQALMDRRSEYWKIHGEPKKETKKAKKQAKKSEGQKKQISKEEGQQLILPAANRTRLNANVKMKNYLASFYPLEKVLSAETHKNNGPGGVVYQLPFQNVNYCCQVRVIDFFPPNVEDFSIQTTHASLPDTDDSSNPRPRYGWQWRFCLLVEGVGPKSPNQQAREPLKLYVTGQDGDHLLRQEASNLRTDHEKLTLIKDTLFVLWGNLEEQKSNAIASGNQTWGPVSSVPFACCIREYGIPCSHSKDSNAMDIDDELCSHIDCFGWERRFALFDTTINPP